MKKHPLILAAGLLPVILTASSLGAEDTLAVQARAALKKACGFLESISTHGGYDGFYSLDLTQRYGESLKQPAKPTQIWVQPPGTPTVGRAFLRAYRATGDPQYLQAARAAALALAWGQRPYGGWDHLVDLSHMNPAAPGPQRKDGRASLDDNICQGAVDFLMELDQTVKEPWLREAVDLGLAYIMKAQFDNGAWPQWYPLIGGYHDDYTFNDGAINACIRVMLKAHQLYQRQDCLNSAKRGGDFIILAQLPAPQAGWGQQYSHDLKPAKARAFEPAGLSSNATSSNIVSLLDLAEYTGESKYLQPIPPAIDWLEHSKIGEDRWARLYEVSTNRPIYGDRDGTVHYSLQEVSEERQHGYSWQSDYKIPAAINRYRQAIEPKKDAPEKPKASPKPERLAPAVKEVLAALDEQGRWVKDGMISSKVFVKNVSVLCDYLEQVKGQQP